MCFELPSIALSPVILGRKYILYAETPFENSCVCHTAAFERFSTNLSGTYIHIEFNGEFLPPGSPRLPKHDIMGMKFHWSLMRWLIFHGK